MEGALNYVRDKSEAFSTKVKAVSDAHLEVDIAVVKATSRDPTPPKEKHVQTLLRVARLSRPETKYIIFQLTQRLEEKTEWIIVLKSCMLVHRMLLEVPFTSSFIEQMESSADKVFAQAQLFHLSKNMQVVQMSAFIRSYVSYLISYW